MKAGVDAFPNASPTDGRLDLAIITAAGLRERAGLVARAVRGSQHLSGHAYFHQATRITVGLDGKHRFELDGGSKGSSKRLDYEVHAAALRVCVAAD